MKMNIKFENIFDTAIKQLKSSWVTVLKNSVIFGVLVFFASILLLLLVGLLFVAAIGFGAAGDLGLAIFFGIIAVIASVFLLFGFGYLELTTEYIVGSASFEGGKLGEVFKATFTKSNIWFYCTNVFAPLFLAVVVYLVAIGISLVLSEGFGIFMMLILLVPLFVLVLYINAVFLLSLYKGTDIKANSVTLKADYTRKQIMLVYLIQVGITLLLGLVLGLFSIIPIIGLLVRLIGSGVGGAVITQAMILAVNGKPQDKAKAEGREVTIQSPTTRVVVNSYGAQIRSVVKGGVEYMWQADPEYWGRTAPVLFPFVGKLKDDQYQAGGEMIAMSQHGFLRDREFTVVSESETSVIFEYTSTLADYELYPCDFTVQISYTVEGNKVTTDYNVINNSSYQIPYQIGAHPAFNVESVDNLTAVFSDQAVTQHFFAGGLQTNTEDAVIGELPLSYDLINKNLPCYSDFSDHRLTLKQSGQDFIKFDFTSMEYLAIWSPEYKRAKFVCIEPWNGICSRADQEGYSLENKDGMNVLAANSSERCSFSFELC